MVKKQTIYVTCISVGIRGKQSSVCFLRLREANKKIGAKLTESLEGTVFLVSDEGRTIKLKVYLDSMTPFELDDHYYHDVSVEFEGNQSKNFLVRTDKENNKLAIPKTWKNFCLVRDCEGNPDRIEWIPVEVVDE